MPRRLQGWVQSIFSPSNVRVVFAGACLIRYAVRLLLTWTIACVLTAPVWAQSGGLSVQALIIVVLSVASVALAVLAVFRYIKLRLSLRDAVPLKENAAASPKVPTLC